MSGEKNTKEKEQALPPKAAKKQLFGYQWVVKNVPFFLFLALLTVLYIYNGHYSEKLIRKISTTEKHITDLEFEYKTIKSEVIFRSKASELEKAVAPLGLKELKTPPLVLGDSTVPKP